MEIPLSEFNPLGDDNELLDINYDDYEVFEYEQNDSPPVLRGRLKAHVKFWEHINANRFIIDTIYNGYRIPFKETPARSMSPNNKSAIEHSEFVESAISDLIRSQSVIEVTYVPHVVSPLSVSVQSSGKKRLILDLRQVNKCVWKQKFKFEDWRILTPYLRKDGFLFNFDLKSGYHHVEIFPDHQNFLGFSWNFQGVKKFFCFTVLPFGLSSAPYIFSKLLRPLVKYWRFNGVQIVVFLDDGCGTAKDYSVASFHSQFVKNSLRNAGFAINSTKSNWGPVQSLVWLGLNWNLIGGVFSITNKRVNNFLEIIDQFLSLAPYVTARHCAKITGHVMSMSPVIGNLTRLKTRYLYRVIESRNSWSSHFNIGTHNEALSEIFFWKNNVEKLNVCPLVEYSVPKVVSFSDASKVGCGAFISGENVVCSRMWNESEASKSSTWRELKAIEFALASFKNHLVDKSVKWYSDNQAAVRILQVGSPKSDLHTIAIDVFSFCKENRISVFSEWIPRDLNEHADAISKIVDFDDWYTSHDFFERLNKLWGSHSVDRFASASNAHLRRFNSKFCVPNTEAVDAFSVSWTGENNWLVPPIHHVSRTVQHLIACKASGTLVVPFWPSSAFWPFLFIDAYKCQPYVTDQMLFSNSSGIFLQGDFKDTVIGRKDCECAVLAVRISG